MSLRNVAERLQVVPVEKRLAFKPEEVALLLGVGRNAVYNAIKRGELKAARVGRRLVVPREEVERLLAG
ncbi:MAG: helix-turn-helix domain-containing protein [Moorellaceae bacterium]